jgi:hypothetical protein
MYIVHLIRDPGTGTIFKEIILHYLTNPFPNWSVELKENVLYNDLLQKSSSNKKKMC